MHGLDTNILIRYLTQDDPVQSKKAAEIFEQRLSPRQPGFVSLVTMAETVWVLESVYGFSATEIAAGVERMLQAESLAIQNEQQVFTAAQVLKSGRGEFADALIGALGAWAGCDSTLTFDRKASRLTGLEVV
jgi:predicted nucleic-acid-binding protein